METIAAIATGNAKSAIGIIRLSGDEAISIADRVFRPKSCRKMRDTEAGRLVYGELLGEDGAVIDLCLCTVSRTPHSYTGEDTAELQCHGSPVVLAEGLRAVFRAGARQAEAGEFTKRAFLNGKLDLTGAEAVADLIDATSAAAAKNASGQLSGAIFTRAEAIYSDLAAMAAHFGAEVDYPDDDIDEFRLESYTEMLTAARVELGRLAATYSRGQYLREGIPTAIVGRPNVGKSSLLNAILGYDRAIVTATAGTTRDTLEETALLGGVPLRLSDTAGLRETADEIEREGVLRASRAAERAVLVFGVFDASEPFSEEDERTLELMKNAEHAIAVLNKSDLPRSLEDAGIPGAWRTVSVSAKTGEGLDALENAVSERFSQEDVPQGEILTNARQADAVLRAENALGSAIDALNDGAMPDIVLSMAEDAMDALASLMGKNVQDDVIHNIFDRFCVGK